MSNKITAALEKHITEPSSGETTPEEKRLEPYLDSALLAGSISLENGSETERCSTIIEKILESSGEKEFDVSVISKSIFAKLGNRTHMTTIKNWGTNMNRIIRANEVSRKLSAGTITVDAAYSELTAIRTESLYGFFFRLFAFAAVIVTNTILGNGNLKDCVAAVICGLALGLIDALLMRVRLHSFVRNMLIPFFMIIFASLSVLATRDSNGFDLLIIAAITPLFPGMALTNAVMDTLKGDYVSGAGRLMEAGVKALDIVFGVAGGLIISMLIPMIEEEGVHASLLSSEGPVFYLIYALAALIFSASYCILLDVPVRFIPWASLIGAAGKMLYFWWNTSEETAAAATFFVTVVIAILAQICAKIFKAPTTTFLIAGLIALVPGRSLYNSVLMLLSGEYREGGIAFLQTIFIAGSIAIAIFAVDVVVQTYKMIRRNRFIKRKND